MSAAYEHMAEEIGAILAPVGREWWKTIHENPEAEMYYMDGEHASPAGSRLAAAVIWKSIREYENSKKQEKVEIDGKKESEMYL